MRDRETARAGERQRERERERKQNLKQAPGSELSTQSLMWLEPTNHKVMT